MNYIADDHYVSVFSDIFGPLFKRIEGNEERCDFYFREFTNELLSEIPQRHGRGDRDYEKTLFQRKGTFNLFKFPQDILYTNYGEVIQELLRIQSTHNNKVIVWGIAAQAFGFKEMIHEYYLFSFPRNLNFPQVDGYVLNHNKNLNGKDEYFYKNIKILTYILQKIKTIL